MRRDPSITARSYEQLASRGPASDDLLLGESGTDLGGQPRVCSRMARDIEEDGRECARCCYPTYNILMLGP